VINPSASASVTHLLVEWRQGDAGARDRLLPLVYDQLRRLAGRQLRRERPDHSLQPTALINELYLLLVQQRATTWDNRAHFFALAAQLMRRILVDHARARHADKRGGALPTIALDDADEPADGDGADRVIQVLAIDEALARLAALDADQARIVELRFFAGLTVEETALVLNRSPRTVKREWRLARAWLRRELRGDRGG
jgi:RNA polymerase sigma factor (TIGR02999 family)